MKYNFLFFLHFELYRKPVCNLVVSLPILTVIPIILLATVDTSFRKNGHKKQISSGMKKAPTISLATYFFISFLCHIVIYAFILLDQLFIANGIHRIPIKTGIVISRYGDQISFPKIRKVFVLKISVELPTNGIKSNAFCIS